MPPWCTWVIKIRAVPPGVCQRAGGHTRAGRSPLPVWGRIVFLLSWVFNDFHCPLFSKCNGCICAFTPTATLNNLIRCWHSQRTTVSIQCYHSCVMSLGSFKCLLFSCSSNLVLLFVMQFITIIVFLAKFVCRAVTRP